MHKLVRAGAALAVLGLFAVATAAGSADKAAADTFVFGASSDPVVLDPALISDGESFRVTTQIYETLVAQKPGTTTLVPGLATSWKSSGGGKTWTFQLRHGVKFQDGTPFNAAAVCANFNRQYNFRGPFQDASATYYWQTVFYGFKHNESKDLSPSLYRSCTTRGKYTAIIHLRRPNAAFLPALVISSFAIQSPRAMKKYGANKGELRNGTFYPTGTYAFSHPTGTGPFKFKQWVVGQKVELVRNNRYWGKKPKIGRVIIQPISNNTARVQALQKGDINGADLIQPQDVPTIKKSNNLKLLNRPSFNVAYVTINSSHAPFNKLAVRQAVAYGLDRASVVKSFYAGRAIVANEFMPPNLFGWSSKVPKYPYSPSKAKQLLQKAGLKLPVSVEFWYPTNVSRPYMPNPKLNFEAFSASLEKSGFKVTAKSAPWRPDYVKHVNDGTAGDLSLIGWTGDFGDPDNFVGTFFQTYSPQF